MENRPMDAWRKLPIAPLLLAGVLFLVTILWIATLPMRESFDDLIIDRSYIEDPSGTLTRQEIAEKPFAAFSGPLFLGNNSRPVWLKLALGPSTQRDWVLMVQPAYTQHVEVWTQAMNGAWQRQVVGSQHNHALQAVGILTPAVLLNVDMSKPSLVYVKVQTATTPLAVRVLTHQDAQRFDSLMHLISGVLIGFGLLMLVISFLVYQVTRERLWLVDVGFNLIGLLLFGLHLGIVGSVVLPHAGALVSQLTLVANALYGAYVVGFFFLIFRLFTLPRWVLLPFFAMPVILAVVLVLIAMGKSDVAMGINNAALFAYIFWDVVIAVFARHPDRFLKGVFRLGLLVMAVYFIFWAMPVVLKIQTGNAFALYPGLPISLFTMLMLMMIMGRNTQLRLVENQQLEKDKIEAERSLAAARSHHEETSSFFGMLLHEVKNPLSSIRMVAANLSRDIHDAPAPVHQRLARLQQAVTQVDDVLERGVEIDQLVHGSLLLSPQRLDIGHWLDGVCQHHESAARLQRRGVASHHVVVDAPLLSLMLANLIDNAVKYSAANSIIFCQLALTETHWQLRVINRVGPSGLPDPQRLFTKYYRASSVLTKAGLGLGLYWVHGIARQMAGDLTYAVDDEEQVVFSLCLPN